MTHYNEQREQEMKKREQRLEELKKQHAELTKEIEKLEAVKVWEPEGGNYTIFADGEVLEPASSRIYAKFGTERKTREQAEKARDKMRVFNRLLAYVDEFAPDYEFVVGAGNYCVFYSYNSKKFMPDGWKSVDYVGSVCMSKQTAIELCEKLNSGEVVL